jgi:hypothetical protein
VWGLPCPRHYCRGGALLPHLFTLTPALPPRRYVFCGTFRPSGLNLTSRTLSGTLLCGVRTFLSSRPRTREAAVRSGCLLHHYIGRILRNPSLLPAAAVAQFEIPNCSESASSRTEPLFRRREGSPSREIGGNEIRQPAERRWLTGCPSISDIQNSTSPTTAAADLPPASFLTATLVSRLLP